MSDPFDPLATRDLTPPTREAGTVARTADAPPPLALAPGQEVPNRPSWTLVRELGRGGFGEVWQVKHEWRRELGAVKFCTHPDARAFLALHEKRVIVRVMRHAGDHPHIVPLVDYDLGGAVPWLLYEYVEGGTLADAVREWRDLPVPRRLGRTVLALYGIARALKRVHRLEPPIVHRDLKPANVLLARGIPRVTDFGIGGAAPESGATESLVPRSDPSVQLPTMLKAMGTFRYASPEQMFGAPPDPRDDVYALGIIAFQLALADLNAAPGTDAADILRELQAPKEFTSLVVRSVAMDPARRPKDAREWERTLREWVPKKADAPSTATQATPQVIRSAPRAPHPVPDPTPKASAEPTVPARPAAAIALNVPGALLARPAGDRAAQWKEVAKLPAAVRLVPEFEYGVRAREALTDADLAGFPTAPAVRHLNLSWCAQLTDAGLAHLRGAAPLEGLDLTGCKRITDAGLAHLAHFPRLKHLNLRWCEQVTDAGLAHLARLPRLRALGLSNCPRVTGAGLAALAGALPRCAVER